MPGRVRVIYHKARLLDMQAGLADKNLKGGFGRPAAPPPGYRNCRWEQ